MNYYNNPLTDPFPLLKKLKDGRILGVYRNTDAPIGEVEIEEECDNHFGMTLTNAELRQLAAELVLLADKLLEPPITPRQLAILRHAINWPNDAYRNHYVTGEGSDDYLDCLALVNQGLMEQTQRDWVPGYIFLVTERGLKLLEATGE